MINLYVFFFFSSRRRHTRFDCDWSSDVCSSDLDSQVYDREKINANPMQLMISLTVMTRAHEESKTKAMRLGHAWAEKRKIGRASCRERVEIAVGAVVLKREKEKRGARYRNNRER